MIGRKQRRIRMLALGGVLLVASAVLVSVAFRDSIVFFFSPTELMAEERSADQRMRLGGLVAEGSVRRGQGETVSFDVTDGNGTVTVNFRGVLPDLFCEGQGIVAEGYLEGSTFRAVEVLAKHDESYMPKEVAESLRAQGHWQEGEEPPEDCSPVKLTGS